MDKINRRKFIKLTGTAVLGLAAYNMLCPEKVLAAVSADEIALNDKNLVYSGRIDMTNPLKPEFIFPASSLQFRFFGRKAVLTLTNKKSYNDSFVGAIVDGVQKKWKLSAEGTTKINLVDDKTAKEHSVLFFKRMDGGQHEFILESLSLPCGGYLLEAPALPTRRIEIYGDSVSAGEVDEAVDYTGKSDPKNSGEFSNSYYSYGWVAARKLNAQLHDIAQGGIALLNGTGWFAAPLYMGMETMWDKVHYHPYLDGGRQSEWDFSRYVPHLVVVAIGQNDNHCNGKQDEYMRDEPNGKRAKLWKKKYQELVLNIRKKYPRAVILLTTTVLNHDISWDNAIEEVCRNIADDRVIHFMYTRNGRGTPGHPRIGEHEEMAGELASFVERLDKKIGVWD